MSHGLYVKPWLAGHHRPKPSEAMGDGSGIVILRPKPLKAKP